MVEPEGIKFEVPAPNQIIVRGMDKELVGEMAAVIRTKRPPEVYRGKGIKYVDVIVDGKFEEDKKDLKLQFRGSSNQRILDVKECLKSGKIVKEEQYL